nr:hypothetical protein [Tanacetum cinerariifolium]
MDFLFSLMFDELLNGTNPVVSKSSGITTTNAPNKRQQQNTASSNSTNVAADIPPLNIQPTPKTISQAPTVTAIKKQKPVKKMHKLKKKNLSTSLVHRYKNEGRHCLVMLIRQTCIHSINDILLNIVGQKIIWYSTQSRAFRVFNKRTRVIVETIHVNFDELPQMASDHVSSDPVQQCQRMALELDILSPGPQSQENVPHAVGIVTTSNELDLLFM